MDIGSIAICITIGALIVFASIGIGVCFGRNDNRDNQGQFDGDSDVRTYIPCRDRNRCRNNGSNKRMEAEEVINGLQIIRMAASRQEKEYIDYACECVAIREKIFDKLIENMKGEKK